MTYTTISIPKELKTEFETLSKELYGAKLSIQDITETGIQEKIEEMRAEKINREAQAKKKGK
jgi:hypothetical protein